LQAKGAFFGNAIVNGARFSSAQLRHSTWTGAEAGFAHFGKTNLRESFWMGATAKGAIFAGAHLEWADFSHADIREADFSHANLTRANLHAVRDSSALFIGANLLGVRKTDVERLEAESYRPPAREKRV
jgi:uncharacterized protein YjbI with pentapeptide repeats